MCSRQAPPAQLSSTVKQRRPQLLLSPAKLRPSLCSHRSKRARLPTIRMTTRQSMRFPGSGSLVKIAHSRKFAVGRSTVARVLLIVGAFAACGVIRTTVIDPQCLDQA
jgi:hypothetical protein